MRASGGSDLTCFFSGENDLASLLAGHREILLKDGSAGRVNIRQGIRVDENPARVCTVLAQDVHKFMGRGGIKAPFKSEMQVFAVSMEDYVEPVHHHITSLSGYRVRDSIFLLLLPQMAQAPSYLSKLGRAGGSSTKRRVDGNADESAKSCARPSHCYKSSVRDLLGGTFL
jgi:hypothetical protein